MVDTNDWVFLLSHLISKPCSDGQLTKRQVGITVTVLLYPHPSFSLSCLILRNDGECHKQADRDEQTANRTTA